VRELARVLRPGGLIYMLVYATEGLRWPLVQMLRPLAQRLGFPALDAAVARAGMPVNRRRTYLDDLFVPYIDFYSWASLEGVLSDAGFERVERWRRGRLDHEETLESYRRDLRGFLEVFEAVEPSPAAPGRADAALVLQAVGICRAAVDYADAVAALVTDGALTNDCGRALAIGQGHHRLTAWKR
jgi:SAM-dependent methyltransferase